MDTATKTDVINIIYNEGEDKPWELKFDDVSMLKTARAAINYPVQKFETEEKAIEVAEMLRDIIHADSVHVAGEEPLLSHDEHAEFFQNIPDKVGAVEDFDIVDDKLSPETIRKEQERQGMKLDTDDVSTHPGVSQWEAEKELGLDKPYPESDVLQDHKYTQ